MRHRRWRKWLWILAAVLVIVYLAGANFLVSAALVPSTMEKLDAFSRITEDSYEAQMCIRDRNSPVQLAVQKAGAENQHCT